MWLGCAIGILAWGGLGCGSAPSTHAQFVTYNVENFPRDERQVRGLARSLQELDAPVVALQEITDPQRLRAGVAATLGPEWRFVTHDATRRAHRVGILFDGARFSLDQVRAHDGVRITPGGRPALEARLVRRDSNEAVRVVAVHFKAGADYTDVRQRQLVALEEVVRGLRRSGDALVVMGDFNAATAIDRVRLASFASRAALTWSSSDVGCTALHTGPDGCRGTALDQVFTSEPVRVRALGPCLELGCAPGGDRCPLHAREVSDHCPVVVSGW